ncbi:MAG: HEAT repeat domain-containing protein [Treponema sp.]|nr:HEAT repeat domain-containing protein [Treponema sp.]
MKRFILGFCVAIVFLFPTAGQESELSVEESYLQESIENRIIREQSRGDSREMKERALAYIDDAISRGNKSESIRQALAYMGLEGIKNRGRENGRLINNYPDIRRTCAKYLGQLGTPEAKETLLEMIYNENEPMVLQEAVKSLADMGIDDRGKTISAITWILQKFHNTNPDNLFALSAIEAYEKFGGINSANLDQNAVEMLNKISEGPYVTPVKDRAMQALVKIRKAQAQAQQEQQQQRQRQ